MFDLTTHFVWFDYSFCLISLLILSDLNTHFVWFVWTHFVWFEYSFYLIWLLILPDLTTHFVWCDYSFCLIYLYSLCLICLYSFRQIWLPILSDYCKNKNVCIIFMIGSRLHFYCVSLCRSTGVYNLQIWWPSITAASCMPAMNLYQMVECAIYRYVPKLKVFSYLNLSINSMICYYRYCPTSYQAVSANACCS